MSEQRLVISRVFNAPPEKVFEAFTRREAIRAWYGPEGFTVPFAKVDARPGGEYFIEMHSPEGSVHIVTGRFRDLEPPERISFTWAWLQGDQRGPETLVNIHLVGKGQQTELTMEHSGFPDPSMRDHHQEGWVSTFKGLEAMLAGQSQPVFAQPLLLGNPRSTFVRAARMAFMEKGISYRLQPELPHSEAIKKIHPFGRIPALHNGPLQLFECSAIIHYIEEAFPGPALMPTEPAARAQVEQWISANNDYFNATMIRRFVLQYFFPKGDDGQPDRVVIEGALDDIRNQLEILNNAYGDHDFLVDNRLTLADLLLAPVIDYVSQMPEGQALLAPYENVRRAHDRMAQRPSFAGTVPDQH